MDPDEEALKAERVVFIEEAMKRVAASPDRITAAAEKSWTIAGALGGVLLALGFADRLQSAEALVRYSGLVAVVGWLASAVVFMSVSIPLGEATAKRQAKAAAEIPDPSGDASELDKKFVVHLRNTLMARDRLASRVRIAIFVAAGAVVATAISLGAFVISGDGNERVHEARLLLSGPGQAAIEDFCPNLIGHEVHNANDEFISGRTDQEIIANVRRDQIDDNVVVEIAFAAGGCQDEAVSLVLPRQYIVATTFG
jgi:hypothetical protein